MKANDTRAKGMVFNQKAGEYIQELEQQLAKQTSRLEKLRQALKELEEALPPQ